MLPHEQLVIGVTASLTLGAWLAGRRYGVGCWPLFVRSN
jgi:hypothetical protein